MFLSNCFFVSPMGTKDHWVNPLPFLKQNCVNFILGGGLFQDILLQYDLYKTSVRPICIKNYKLFSILFAVFACYFYFLSCGLLTFFWNVSYYGQYKFANSSISSTFITFIPTSVLYSTYFVLEILSFIISYSMSISSKDLYLVISVSVKERRKFLGDNSIFLFQTLTSRFIIATVFLDTVKPFFLYLLT